MQLHNLKEYKNHLWITLIMLLIITAGCWFSGCNEHYLPEQDKVTEIEQSAYVHPGNDCVDKSIRLGRYYKSKGIKHIVVSGFVSGNREHAWVEVWRDGTWYLVDPTVTDVIDGYPVEQYKDVYTKEKVYIGDEIYRLDERDIENFNYRNGLCWLSFECYIRDIK